MSALSVSLISFIGGLFFLIIRLFFFVDIKEVDKLYLKKVKLNSFLSIILSILFISESVLLFFIFYEDFKNPVEILEEDFYKGKIFFGSLIIFLGAVFIYYKEKIFEDWKKIGYRVPANYFKYRLHIILIGILLVVVGFIMIVI
ncbi:MAG: hypothetical protein ACHQLA_06390 [Ignavibacteriales bacterium]